ncbi:MAG: head GIN domain-containing protein, partial [Bacteroidota bacterium]
MRKTTMIPLGLLTLAFISLNSFILNVPDRNVVGNRNEISELKSSSEKIPVDEFNSVAIAVTAKTYIEQGSEYRLEIETSPETMEKIKVGVRDDKLVIEPEKPTTRIRDEITIYIVAPDYKTVSLAGSGELFADKKMKLEESELKIAGSGKMHFENLRADEMKLKISGSGDINIKGDGAEEMAISIAGSGDINCTGFPVEELEAKISGSGDCKVWVNGEIHAFIAGSGSIHYKGNPQI